MAEDLPPQEVANVLRNVLRTIDAGLAGKNLDPGKLADLKSGIDDVRLRLWGALSSANAEDHAMFVTGFRLRRATEMCDALADDLGAGRLSPEHEALLLLNRAAQRLTGAVTVALRTPPPPL